MTHDNLDETLRQINEHLHASAEDLKSFADDLFNIAKRTSVSLDMVSAAAIELAKQGLSADDIIKRTQDAVILSRLSGLEVTDAKFAISSEDLSDAISRVGSAAESAGVGINELTAHIMAIQEKTARSGVVIGNGLKTIFANLDKMSKGSFGPGNWIIIGGPTPLHALECAAQRWRSCNDIQRRELCQDVGGPYHANLASAILSDLNSPDSVYYATLNKLLS